MTKPHSSNSRETRQYQHKIQLKRKQTIQLAHHESDKFKLCKFDSKSSRSFEDLSSRGLSVPSTSSCSYVKPGRKNFLSRSRSSGRDEVYKTEYVTAMTVTHLETFKNYVVVVDQWKPEWHKGVQVPNNETNLMPSPNVYYHETTPIDCQNFQMPEKFIYSDINKELKNESNHFDAIPPKYEYDETDAIWIEKVNQQLIKIGEEKLTPSIFENMIELLETQSNNNLKRFLDSLKNYDIVYDEDIVCEVCRDRESEPENEMVFCDGCNICVHQRCYGIEQVPSGPWYCSTCQFGGVLFKPECLLCSNKGGAMKPTRNNRYWCHVSCVRWIPGPSFGNDIKLEPITNLQKIPASRSRVICILCKIKKGYTVQCAEKNCFKSFHITCAFRHNLFIEKSLPDNKCYCKEHSNKSKQLNFSKKNKHVSRKKGKNLINKDEEKYDEDLKKRKFLTSLHSMTVPERTEAALKEFEKMYNEFYKNIDLDRIKSQIKIKSSIAMTLVFNYWKLKRRFNNPKNKALIYPRDVNDFMNQERNIITKKYSILNKLRFDMEKLRNLISLIRRREILKKNYNEHNRLLFQKQVEYSQKYKAYTGPLNSISTDSMSSYRTAPNIYIIREKNSLSKTITRENEVLQVRNDNCIYDWPQKWTSPQLNHNQCDSEQDVKQNKENLSNKVEILDDVGIERTEQLFTSTPIDGLYKNEINLSSMESNISKDTDQKCNENTTAISMSYKENKTSEIIGSLENNKSKLKKDSNQSRVLLTRNESKKNNSYDQIFECSSDSIGCSETSVYNSMNNIENNFMTPSKITNKSLKQKKTKKFKMMQQLSIPKARSNNKVSKSELIKTDKKIPYNLRASNSCQKHKIKNGAFKPETQLVKSNKESEKKAENRLLKEEMNVSGINKLNMSIGERCKPQSKKRAIDLNSEGLSDRGRIIYSKKIKKEPSKFPRPINRTMKSSCSSLK